MSDATVYTWHGVWDEGAGGWIEYFGQPDGLPARDLTAADIDGFTDEQRAKLESVTGHRLYQHVGNTKPAKSGNSKHRTKGKPVEPTVSVDPGDTETEWKFEAAGAHSGAASGGSVSESDVP